jgi:RimJ/RimL family protein N-acetyltransferase
MFGLWHDEDIAGLFMLSRAGARSEAIVTCEIAPRYRKQGIGTAALTTLIDGSAAEFGFQKFSAEINADNIASYKMAKHVGFTVMGMVGADLQLEYRVPTIAS